MKQILCIAIWLTGLLLAASCTPQHNLNALLMQADSLIEEHPDSALRILESINPEQLHTQPNRAFYALLLTQARDKNYIVQTDDSLIQTAVQYYDSIGDALLQAKAYYYKGSVYRDANQSGKAIKEYLTAIGFAEKANDKKLLGLIYNNAGYLYYKQDLLEQANAIYQQTEELAKQQNDTSLWAEALSFRGRINIKNGTKHYPIAEDKLLEALELTNTADYKLVQADIAASLSSLYTLMNQSKKAIHYGKLNIALRDDTLRCYKAFSILGNAYVNAEQYDSAALYINKSLSSTLYDIKANAYLQLAIIAEAQGDLNSLLVFTQKHTLYKDSINWSQQSNDILNAEKVIAKQQYANSLSNRYPKHTVLITGSILLAIIIGFIVLMLFKHRKDTHKLKQDQYNLEQEQQILQQEYLLLREKLNIKDSEIASLKNSMNQQHINEVQINKTKQELTVFYKERETLAKEAFQHSNIYAKMERIIKSFELYDESDEKMSEEDWMQLIAETDMRYSGAVTRLDSRCQLDKKELHLCCLYLSGFANSKLKYLSEYGRSSIYRKEKDILIKLGYSPESVKLKDILKKI